jgi:protein-disulfide isomerase
VTCRAHVLRVEPDIRTHYVADGRVQLAFHHILDLGAGSLLGSTAAECAGQQQPLAFWRMHDLLYERQGDLYAATAETVTAWAGELGLDDATFQACLGDPAVAAKVQQMDEQRRSDGVRLRPTFHVNGQRIEGAAPYAAFAAALDEALNRKQ